MLIIADSGSTKCTWVADDGARTTSVRTRGINAVQHSAEQIREALAELPPYGAVTAVRFYGAGGGASFPEASEKLRRELAAHFGTEEIVVESDLLGAARALFGRGEGIACILGTGSNSCWCRGGEILTNVPPLGYVQGLPVSFVGGIAARFGELLRETLEAEDYRIGTIVESPAEGLLKYHHGR